MSKQPFVLRETATHRNIIKTSSLFGIRLFELKHFILEYGLTYFYLFKRLIYFGLNIIALAE